MLAVLILVLLVSAIPTSAQDGEWLERARVALESGDLTTARLAATNALSADPKTADAEVVLGLVDTAENHLSAAAEHFGRAVSLQPNNYRAHAYLGSTYLRQEKVVEARKSFEKVLSLNPDNAAAHYNLGVISLIGRNSSAALPHFAAVVKANASDTAGLIGLLECQLDLKQTAAADESARKLGALLPSTSPALLQIGTTLADVGDYPSALAMFRKFVAGNPDSFDGHYNLALAMLRTGAFDDAAVELEAILGRIPKAEAYNLLGDVEEKRGHADKALRAFEQAAQMDPRNEDFTIDYGSALINAGDLNRAVPVFAQAAGNWPHSVRSRLGLASAYYLAGKHEECARVLLEGIAVQPNATPLYDLLGKTFEAVPPLQPDIKGVFEKYVATHPNDAVACAHLGTMLYLTSAAEGVGRFARAKEQLRRAIAVNPRLAEAHLQLGIVAQAEGDLPQALASYQRAAALAPTLSAARYRLGSVYRKLGNSEKAKAELDQFRKLKASEAQQEREQMIRSLSDVHK